MSASLVHASVAWGDLASVIGWGLGAGIGLTLIFSLAIRGFTIATVARRDGESVTASLHLLLGVVSALGCSAAVFFALVTMLHR